MRPFRIAVMNQPAGSAISNISLLHFNGSDGSTTFTDETGKTWSASGNAQLDTAIKKFGTAALLLDGAGDYISATDAAFAFGLGDFTVEFFAYWAVAGNKGLFSTSLTSTPGQLALAYDGSSLQLNYNGSESDYGFSPTLGVFYHLAVVRSGSSLKSYIDGVQAHSVTDSSNKSNTTFYLGAYWNSSFTFNGTIDEFRISDGARYTSGFTPPTGEFS